MGEMVKKEELAKLKISNPVKELIASQIEGLCGTYEVVKGFAKTIDDKTNVEDFSDPLELPEVMNAILEADKVHYM